jgi:hypothetical protein
MLDHIESETLHQKVFDFIESKAKIQTVKKDQPNAREDKP